MEDAAAAAAATPSDAAAAAPAADVKMEDAEGATAAAADGPAAKQIKLEDGTASPVHQPPQQQQQQQQQKQQQKPSPAAAAAAGPDDFVLSDDLGAIILNFLVRMAFLIGEGSEKDPELMALHGHTLSLVDLALELFPHQPVKLGQYLERLLQVGMGGWVGGGGALGGGEGGG